MIGLDSSKQEMPDDPPPILGSWRRVYIAVVIYLGALIALFYLFTKAFSA